MNLIILLIGDNPRKQEHFKTRIGDILLEYRPHPPTQQKSRSGTVTGRWSGWDGIELLL